MALHLEIVTPTGSALQLDVEEVALPGKIGEFAVLDGHIPLMSALRPGVLRYRIGNEQGYRAVGSGFAEVGAADKVLVLTNQFLTPDEIELEDAERELAEAEDAIKGYTGETEELDEDSDAWKERPEFRTLLDDVDWARACIDVKKSSLRS